MTDMVEKCREFARELTQDRARILSREQLINLSAIILTLLDVVEESKRVPCCEARPCFGWCIDFRDALAAAESRVDEILERGK